MDLIHANVYMSINMYCTETDSSLPLHVLLVLGSASSFGLTFNMKTAPKVGSSIFLQSRLMYCKKVLLALSPYCFLVNFLNGLYISFTTTLPPWELMYALMLVSV